MQSRRNPFVALLVLAACTDLPNESRTLAVSSGAAARSGGQGGNDRASLDLIEDDVQPGDSVETPHFVLHYTTTGNHAVPLLDANRNGVPSIVGTDGAEVMYEYGATVKRHRWPPERSEDGVILSAAKDPHRPATTPRSGRRRSLACRLGMTTEPDDGDPSPVGSG